MRSNNLIISEPMCCVISDVIAKDIRDSIATYIDNQFNGSYFIDNQLSFFRELIVVTVITFNLELLFVTHMMSKPRDIGVDVYKTINVSIPIDLLYIW